jgi:hypothetical protein
MRINRIQNTNTLVAPAERRLDRAQDARSFTRVPNLWMHHHQQMMTSAVDGQTNTDHRGTLGGASRSLWSVSATVTQVRHSKPRIPAAVKMT